MKKSNFMETTSNIPEDLMKFKGVSKEKKVSPEQKRDWFEEFCDKNKSDNQWHRTFNNQSMRHSIDTGLVVGMIVTAWGMVSVALVGVIFYLLKNMIFG